MLLTNASTLAVANLAVRFEMSTVTSTIQDEGVTAVQLPKSVKRRKNRMAKDGSAGFRDTVGVWRRRALIAESLVECTTSPDMSTIFATTMWFVLCLLATDILLLI